MSWFSGRKKGAHASAGVRLPLARADELVVEEVGDEVLVYDQRTAQAHCLGSEAARVWRGCDGRTTMAELSAALELDEETVIRALEELGDCGLLDTAAGGGVTRREATARLAKVGAAAASAPLIYSIVAPTPALAVTEAQCNALFPCTRSMSCSAAGVTECHDAGCVCCHAHTRQGPGNFSICTSSCPPTPGSPCPRQGQVSGCPPDVIGTGDCS